MADDIFGSCVFGFDQRAAAGREIVKAVGLVGALAVLTPWTLPRLSLFPPVVLIFIAAFETLWQRSASHAPDPIKPVAAKDD